MCPAIFITLVMIAAVLGVIAFIFWVNTVSVKTTLQGCGGRLTGFNSGVLEANGRQVVFHYQPRSKNSPSVLRLTLTGNFFAHAVFHSETSADRLAKNLGLNQELQLNDPGFDREVYIECEDRGFIDQLLRESDTRDLVRNLLGKFTRLEIKGCKCMLVKTPCDDLAIMSSNEITAAALGLDQLASQLPSAVGGERSATPVTDECRRLEQFSITVAAGTVVAGVVLMIWGLAAFDPVMKGRLFGSSLYVSLPLAGLAGYYLFNQLKGLSTSARSFMTAALLSVIGLVLCIWGGGMVLNGLLDISQGQAHKCVVINKRVTHSKNSTSYYVRTSSWDEKFPTYEFSVSPAQYGQLSGGDPCLVTTRAGYLGFEWVVSHACSRRSDTISNP